ncbi:hypothetical protein AAFC00_000769 [Neodothiora populina]|uniref:C2H2-type domain-containing protein n=1 Tax=Neodothiora populina TaxID=2781224 RepID=A0ABR3PMR4_9PEZI
MNDHTCKICSLSFSRTDHFRRHQLRHTGEKPYKCEFCTKAFTRSEKLRDHYNDCNERGNREIPRSAPKGRRRHACEQCITSKKRCDGHQPCNWCREKSYTCRRQPDTRTPTPESIVIEHENEVPDRGSINFLLNAGTEGWLVPFNFPRPIDHVRSAPIVNDISHYAGATAGATAPVVALPARYIRAFQIPTTQPLDGFQTFDENLTSYFSNPFGLSVPQDLTSKPFLIPGGEDLTNVAADPACPAAPPNQDGLCSNLISSIYSNCWKIGLDPAGEQAILSTLEFLLTPERVTRFTALFFSTWQPNFRTIYAPGFDINTSATTLVVAIVLMGAMFSDDAVEMVSVRRILDIAEVFIFSTSMYTPYQSIRNAYQGIAPSKEDYSWERNGPDLQAAFLMFIIQYWGGNGIARKRALEMRFPQLVTRVREMGLTRTRHLPEDSISEQAWIRKECQVRIMNCIWLVDCSFIFFVNFPPHFDVTEMQCDLPSKDSLFESLHPFSLPDFSPSRRTTILDILQDYLHPEKDVDGRCIDPLSKFNAGPTGKGMLAFDTFVVIHALYVVLHSRMRLRFLVGAEHDTFVSGHRQDHPDFLQPIRAALDLWHQSWQNMRASCTPSEWESLGFWKNGYPYWLIMQLLLTKKARNNYFMLAEPCIDKLARLRTLMQDEP